MCVFPKIYQKKKRFGKKSISEKITILTINIRIFYLTKTINSISVRKESKFSCQPYLMLFYILQKIYVKFQNDQNIKYSTFFYLTFLDVNNKI